MRLCAGLLAHPSSHPCRHHTLETGGGGLVAVGGCVITQSTPLNSPIFVGSCVSSNLTLPLGGWRRRSKPPPNITCPHSVQPLLLGIPSLCLSCSLLPRLIVEPSTRAIFTSSVTCSLPCQYSFSSVTSVNGTTALSTSANPPSLLNSLVARCQPFDRPSLPPDTRCCLLARSRHLELPLDLLSYYFFFRLGGSRLSFFFLVAL